MQDNLLFDDKIVTAILVDWIFLSYLCAWIIKLSSCIWFCLKALQIYVQFIEGGADSDTNSDGEGADSVEDLNDEANSKDDDSSQLLEQVILLLAFVVITDTRYAFSYSED